MFNPYRKFIKPFVTPLKSRKDFVDQSVIHSVFLPNKYGFLSDVLSQVIQNPSSPLAQILGSKMPDKPTHLSDEDLLNLVRSRYAQSPSELTQLRNALDSLNVPDHVTPPDSTSESSTSPEGSSDSAS